MPILADIIFAVRIHCKTAFGGWRRSVGKIKNPNDHFWTVLGVLATRATLHSQSEKNSFVIVLNTPWAHSENAG